MQNLSTQPEDAVSATEHILSERNYPRQPAYLLAALEDVSTHFGKIPAASKALLLEYFGVDRLPEGIEETLPHRHAGSGSAIAVCAGPFCTREGNDEMAAALSTRPGITVERSHCMGFCNSAPCVRVGESTVTEATLEKVLAALD